MKTIIHVSLRSRFFITILTMTSILLVGTFLVIASLSESATQTERQTYEHIDNIILNSEINHLIYQLSSRLQTLKNDVTFNKEHLEKENLEINTTIQVLRNLSKDNEITQNTDQLTERFTQLINNSIRLSNTLATQEHIDQSLLTILNNAKNKLQTLTKKDFTRTFFQSILLLNTLLDQHHQIKDLNQNPSIFRSSEAMKNAQLKTQEYLGQFKITVDALTTSTNTDEEMNTLVGLKTISNEYHSNYLRFQADLVQQFKIMESLKVAENRLIDFTLNEGNKIQSETMTLKNQLYDRIQRIQKEVILLAIAIIIISFIFFRFQFQRNIQRPMAMLTNKFHQFDAINEPQPETLKLNRYDEWQQLEEAFNQMALRLTRAYKDLKYEQSKLSHIAHHDTLTGLGNRLKLYEELDSLIHQPNKAGFSLLYLDIDRFKNINDTLGHEYGDKLLNLVSLRLLDFVNSDGKVYRLGGDEFVVIYPLIHQTLGITNITRNINDILSAPYTIDENTILTSASIGVCIYPQHGKDTTNLLKNADAAMYQSKQNGRNGYCLYNQTMSEEAQNIFSKSIGIRQAISNNEFEMFYQPQFDLVDERITGVEALIRWNHPTLGLITPDQFLPVAEEAGIITEIDDWVFDAVIRDISEWSDAELPIQNMHFCINFSAKNFLRTDLVQHLSDNLDDVGCDPSNLIIEITEQALVSSFETCSATMKELQSLGMKIAIDDFGTGYSSLNYLKHLPAEIIKIDRSFITDISYGNTDMAIVQAVLTLAKNMKMRVIVEGIETKQQQDLLTSIGCTDGQGYELSFPLTKQDLTSLIENKEQGDYDLSSPFQF